MLLNINKIRKAAFMNIDGQMYRVVYHCYEDEDKYVECLNEETGEEYHFDLDEEIESVEYFKIQKF